MGDKIFVVHDGIAETYPAQTGVFFCVKLEDGSANDIPQKHIRELTELGWFEEVQLENTQRVGVTRLPGDAANPEDAGEEINISVELPESWEFENVDSNEYREIGAVASGCIIDRVGCCIANHVAKRRNRNHDAVDLRTAQVTKQRQGQKRDQNRCGRCPNAQQDRSKISFCRIRYIDTQ